MLELMALDSRKQSRQQAKASDIKPKTWKSDVNQIGLKALELKGREVDTAKCGVAHV